MKLVLKKECKELNAVLTNENYEDINIPTCQLVDHQFLFSAKKGNDDLLIEITDLDALSFKELDDFLTLIYKSLSLEQKKTKPWETRELNLSTFIIGERLNHSQTMRVFQAIETSIYKNSTSLWAQKRNQSFDCINDDMKNHLINIYPHYRPIDLSFFNQCSNWLHLTNQSEQIFYPWLHLNGVIWDNTRTIRNENQLKSITLDLSKLANSFSFLNMIIIFLDQKNETKFGLEVKFSKVKFHCPTEALERVKQFLIFRENTLTHQDLSFDAAINKTICNTNEYPLSIKDIHKILEATNETQKQENHN